MFKDKKAHDAIVKARTVLLVTQPFYGCLALHLNLVEVLDPNEVDTMAVDGINMYYHPPYVLSLKEPELVGVVAHEVSHCAYQHMIRRVHRDPMLWNIAGDFIINSDLKKVPFVLPGVPLAWRPNAKPTDQKGHLYDPQFDGLSTEETYERIKQSLPPPQAGAGGGGDGKDGMQGGQTIKDFGGCGTVKDAAKAGDAAQVDAVAREWEATVRLAVAAAKAANAGSVPGHLERLVEQLKQPRIDWRSVLRQFIDNSMTKDYTWSRPNRRFASSGIHLPGYIPDAMHHLIGIIDISGSISDDLMIAMVSEMAGALDAGVADRLTMVYADTEVRHVDEYVQGDLVQAKTMGGGGTDFADSFKWVEKNAPDGSCIVYLTDMMTSSFGHDVGIPTLWGCYLPTHMLAHVKPPFGDIVSIDGAD